MGEATFNVMFEPVGRLFPVRRIPCIGERVYVLGVYWMVTDVCTEIEFEHWIVTLSKTEES